MNLSSSEQNTLAFYQWEYRHRGYYHFDTPINIEPPYMPFRYSSYREYEGIDDGRVPNIFQRIGDFFSLKEEELKEKKEEEYTPQFLSYNDNIELVGITINFPDKTIISSLRNIEFLNMLSYSEYPISFEIIGTSENITLQIITSKYDRERIVTQLRAYFAKVIIQENDNIDFGFNLNEDIAIADFGLNDEFMRPITFNSSSHIDPLTSVIAIMDSLYGNDRIVLQIIFKGITSPLAKDIHYAVSDGQGGSFFSDAPEMPVCAKAKTASPLFSVVFRIATQGKDNYRSQYLAQEVSRSITQVSHSEYNSLIPLSNEGYSYDFHEYNLHHRTSNRLGFILNSQELSTFVHYPNETVNSSKLGFGNIKTKLLPQETIAQKYVLGINEHNGKKQEVCLNDQMKLRHTHIIGVTGVGKSTLIANMIIDDMKKGNGCALFDPHGDIVDDILLRIPEHRKDDVIIIDPSDTDFPIGFNLLHATTESEKVVLNSDLVSAFRNQSTAWGDKMTSVLTNAVNAFLESTQGGTIIELKRFLIEDSFRKEFLQNVNDPSIHYYWNNEYPMVKKGIAPLLTRIDIFLNSKVIRYMLAQKQGIDFRTCIEEKKIVLIKLSQGLIGEQNSFLLASLFIAKFNQVAMGRQSIHKSQRHPYYIYCDEFQNYITDSIQSILSGARKYGLGLVLVHQELAQIQDSKILNSVISNPFTRICFRLGDDDAKRLATGFSYFEPMDFQSLDIGETISRIGGNQNDCNVNTSNLIKPRSNANLIESHIIESVRKKYATPVKEIEKLLHSLLPKTNVEVSKIKQPIPKVKEELEIPKELPIQELKEKENSTEKIISNSNIEKEKEEYLKDVTEKETIRKHRYLQNHVKTIAIQRGYKGVLEEKTKSGGRVDISLLKERIRIAVEVSVTNTIDYEVGNIIKCIEDGYTHICMLSESLIHLKNIKKRSQKQLNKKQLAQVTYLTPLEFPNYLDALNSKEKKVVKRVRGYRVKSNHIDIQRKDADEKGKTIKDVVLQSLKNKKKK